MAGTRTRLDPTMLKLVNDMVFSDYWADTTKLGVTARPSMALKYTGNADPADDLADAGADQRHRQLPDARRADLHPRSHHQWRHHDVHCVPQRS